MHLSSSPSRSQVVSLLSQCGLPSDDIRDEYLPNFVLASVGESPIGVAGLQVFGQTALVRSVGVVPEHRQHGVASALLSALEAKARELGVTDLYLLTNDAQQYFAKYGYTELSRCSAPAEIQGCSQFGSSCCGAATLMRKSLAA